MKLNNKKIFEATRYKKETDATFSRWQDQILEYEKQGGYYVHFSYVPRMSLYLVNDYNTPIGFYVYPLKRDKISDFAIDRPYAIIIKPKSNAKILQLADYSDTDLANDIKKLIDFRYSQEEIDTASEEAKFDTAAAKIWNITRVLSGASHLDESKKFLYEEFSDQEQQEIKNRFFDMIHQSNLSIDKKIEIYQKEFSQEEKDFLKEINLGFYYFAKAKFDSLMDKNISLEDKIKAYQKDFSQEEKDFLITVDRGLKRFREILKSKFSSIKNFKQKKEFLKLLSPAEREVLSQVIKLDSYIPHKEKERGGGVTGKWTMLLRKLGYDGVNDDCLEIIHENEPCQAVFFDTTKLDLVKIIDLKDEKINKPDNLFAFNYNKFRNPKLKDEDIEKLLKNLPVYYRQEIARFPYTASQVLYFLAKDRESTYLIKSLIASHHNAPPEALKLLYNTEQGDGSYNIKLKIAQNPNTPQEILKDLADKVELDSNYRRSIAQNPNAPPESLKALFRDGNSSDIDKYLAKNSKTPQEVLEVLAKNDNYSIRVFVAENPNTPPEVLADLAKVKNDSIRFAVAKNENTPPETLGALAESSSSHVRTAIAINKKTPVKVLKIFAKDQDFFIRMNIAKNEKTPIEILKVLASDTEEEVRTVVAHNPNTPPETLTFLAKNATHNVRKAIINNKNTPIEAFAFLANNKDKHIRMEIAQNEKIPIEILKVLASDTDEYVRDFAQTTLEKLKYKQLTEAIIIQKIFNKLVIKNNRN